MFTDNQPSIVSGDGDSPETAVTFTPCSIPVRVAAERRYICERFGEENAGWTWEMHATPLDFISAWSITLSDGTQRSVYFDAKVSLGVE